MNLIQRIKNHAYKQTALLQISSILSDLSHQQISGQNALVKCLPIADKLKLTEPWENKAHVLESNVYTKIYKYSIRFYDTDDRSKNKDRIAWYYLRKYNQPFIHINHNLDWTPFKKKAQYDKAVITLKSLVEHV